MSGAWNSEGLCRLCHQSEGLFRRLEASYTHEGKEHIYSAVLNETFGIVISSYPSATSIDSICCVCEERLRDAALFKKQVLDCEEEFKKVHCPDKTLPCSLCEQKFETEEILQTHIKTHLLKSCLICPEIFNKNNDLIEHYALKHGDGKNYPCPKCAKVFDKPVLLKRHCSVHVGNEFKCTECDKEFGRRKDLRDHILEIHKVGDAKLICNICKREYMYPESLKHHMKKHEEIKEPTEKGPNICQLCNEEFDTITDLIKHYGSIHKQGTKYPCTLCTKVLDKPVLLKNHVNFVHFSQKYKCAKCKIEFQSKSDLQDHLETHASEYRCSICDKVYLKSAFFKNHMKVHTGELKVTCDFCGKNFTQKSELKRHILIVHMNYKPYSCKICKKSFAAKKVLAKHKIKHIDKQPYKCDICKIRFTALTTLILHKKVHFDYKLYSCPFCGLQFGQVTSYNLHVKTHTGDEPFSCDICQKTFSLRRNLRKHRMVHSDEKPYGCEICNRSFRDKSSYKRHNTRIHAHKEYTS